MRRVCGRVSAGVGLGLLALSGAPAQAAAVGTLITAVGPLTALVAMFAITGWSANGPAAPLSVAACLLGAGAAVAWLARERMRSAAAPALPAGQACVALPPGWEREALLCEMRQHFLAVQRAWDIGDVPAMQALATPDMLAELLLERGRSAAPENPGETPSEVLVLNATLLAFDESPLARVVSIEFSGAMRDSPQADSVPFRELWMVQSVSGEGAWRLARHLTLL